MATTKKALASKSAKKIGPHTLVNKIPEVVPPNPLSEKLTQLSELINLATANATGDRSPQSYNAEMDALNKAVVLMAEIRAL